MPIIIDSTRQTRGEVLVLMGIGAVLYFVTGGAPTILFVGYAAAVFLVLMGSWNSPARVEFNAEAKVLQIHYFLGGRWGRVERFPFSDLRSVRSYLDTASSESGPLVSLEVILADGVNRRITSAAAIAPDEVSRSSWKGYKEPLEISRLREQIARVTGASDRGFSGGEYLW